MGLLYQIKQTWSPKFFLSTIWPSFEKRNNKRLCCFDIKRLTSCRITMKRSQDHSQKTQRPGTIDSDKKCANMLLRVRKQNTLFEKFVCIFRSKEIVLLAESEYSSKRFFTIRKLQIGFSKSTPGVMIKDLLFFGWAIAFFSKQLPRRLIRFNSTDPINYKRNCQKSYWSCLDLHVAGFFCLKWSKTFKTFWKKERLDFFLPKSNNLDSCCGVNNLWVLKKSF